jgi:hypothetical protein
MFVTALFSLNLKFSRCLSSVSCILCFVQATMAQTVPSQANTDSSAQRRLQETAREAQRQRRIEEQIQILVPALASDNLAGPGGLILARKALAAMVRLREEGVSPDEAVLRATRSSGMDSHQTAKPGFYLRNLLRQKAGQITPPILGKLEAGEDPAPALSLPPYQP